MAAGGTYYEPGDETSPVAFQPLANIDKRAERIWASQFVLNLLAAQRYPETTQLKGRISEALASLASAPPPHRTLSVLAGMIGPELGAVLRPYTIDQRPVASARSSTPTTTSFATPRGSTSRWAR